MGERNMNMMKRAATMGLTAATLVLVAGCVEARQGLLLPEGQVAAGKEAVRAMQCFVCHEIAGGEFPAPHAQPPVSVRLGAVQAPWSRERLAGSILAPAHPLADGRMGDYGEAMTVRQLVDNVAYLQSLGG
jgi:hypothetical protein